MIYFLYESVIPRYVHIFFGRQVERCLTDGGLFVRLGVTEVFDRNLPASRFGSYLRRLSGRGPRKAPARTFPAAMPVLQLDRVYVRGFDVVNAKVLFGASWARLSDHAPIITELILQPVNPLTSAATPNEMTHERG